MIRTWQIDEATRFCVQTGLFGRATASVNGRAFPNKFNSRKKQDLRFELLDGREGSLTVRPQFASLPEIWLTVGGQRMVESGKEPPRCPQCGITGKPYDRFCTHCGHAMPSAETYTHQRNVRQATRYMLWLAVLFALSGIILFFMIHAQETRALASLSGLDAHANYPKPIQGVTYTVGALRQRILWEEWSPLAVNAVLAVIMLVLALWGRRAPLPAILIGAATYGAVVVLNGVVNPLTLAQGFIIKLVIVAMFYRGIKAALALRSADA